MAPGHESQFLVIGWCDLCAPDHHMRWRNLHLRGGLVRSSSFACVSHQVAVANWAALSKGGDPKTSNSYPVERWGDESARLALSAAGNWAGGEGALW